MAFISKLWYNRSAIKNKQGSDIMNTNKDLNYRLYIQREEQFKRTSFDREMSFYHLVSSGNTEAVKKYFEERIRKNFNEGKGTLSDNPVTNKRYHLIISLAVISRICIMDGMNHDVAYTLGDIYIRKADKSTSEEEILELQYEMFMDFCKRMKEIRKNNATSIHIRKCIDYIYDHLAEKITVVDAAEHLKIDPTYLSKLFIRETGTSFRKYIINAKVSVAKNMIISSELTFLEISLSLGFSSQSAFISTFRKITGETPGEFKKKHHEL
jgi:YesN/AraC family two-component response regulator